MEDIPQPLTNGGDCTLHFHSADRTPTHDTLARLDQLERVVSVTTTYLAKLQDDIILADTTGGAFTITLPVANRGQRIMLIRKAGASNVTVARSGVDLINGATTATISSSFAPLRLKAYQGIGWING